MADILITAAALAALAVTGFLMFRHAQIVRRLGL